MMPGRDAIWESREGFEHIGYLMDLQGDFNTAFAPTNHVYDQEGERNEALWSDGYQNQWVC